MSRFCGCLRGHKVAPNPIDKTNIDDVCSAWVQKKYGSKYKVVSVDTSDLKVMKGKINYVKKNTKETQSVKQSAKTYINRLDIPVEQVFSAQSTKKYTCVWTKTKGLQLSGGLSVTVGLPAAVGLSANVGGQINLSDTETTTSGTDETAGQVTRLQQPPRSTLVAEIITTEKVVRMPYSLSYRLQGKISFDLEKYGGTRKEKSVNVAELYKEFGGRVDANGKTKSVVLTSEGTLKTSIEVHQVVEMKEPDADKVMKMIHKDLLNDNREKIAEEVGDKQALSKVLQATTTEKGISEEQFNSVSQKSSVKEGVDELVNVLTNAEPEKFLVFVDILQREGYNELAELLDPRGMYPDSVRHISNLSGVVDHYFVTKKEREVKDSLESGRGVILHGMPGSGKTQLAYKVAGDYARVHPHSVVWVIDGSSEEKLNDGITNLQQRLSGETNVDNSLFQSVVSRWKHILLLINDLSPQVEIPTYVLSSSAKMIVTTQDSLREFQDVANIPIEGFTEDEAVAFLSPKMPTGTSPEQMRELANIFSCLPLGLAAARTSIHRGKMTVEEYKQQLYIAGKEALKLLMEREGNWLHMHYRKEHQDAARDIFAALQLAIDKLDDPCKPGEERKCKVMLQPCAFLEPNNIPVLILKSALESPTIGADAHFTERMRMYSLGSIEGAGVKRHLSIHGITQMAIRLHMDKQQQTICMNKVLQILVKFFVKDMTYSKVHKFSLALMPHVKAALTHAPNYKLELGAEYPLMKARLLMVYGHLLIQRGTPLLSKICLEKAEESLLQFADMISLRTKFRASRTRPSEAGPSEAGPSEAGPSEAGPSEAGPSGAGPSEAGREAGPSEAELSVPINPDYQSALKDLYQSLVQKSQSLGDGLFEETVIRRAITKQNLRAVSDKLGPKHRTTRKLENMVENFEPLTMEMYKTLVDSNLAIPVRKLKRIFLPELYISIIFTFSKAILDLAYDDYRTDLCFTVPHALDMCTEVINDTGVSVMVRFLADMYTVEPILLKAVETLILHETKGKDAATRSYDFGLLTSDTLLKLNYYENVMVCCIKAVQQAKEDKKAEDDKKPRLISFGQDTCKKMLELVESERQAGNPPLRLSEYYMTAGQFSAEVEELEKAAEMFWKAYRVELKREEYHPRMEKALMGLITVRINQSKLRSARLCAQRLLQLTKDFRPEKVPDAEKLLRMVNCRIALQAIKENKENVYGKVTTPYHHQRRHNPIFTIDALRYLLGFRVGLLV